MTTITFTKDLVHQQHHLKEAVSFFDMEEDRNMFIVTKHNKILPCHSSLLILFSPLAVSLLSEVPCCIAPTLFLPDYHEVNVRTLLHLLRSGQTVLSQNVNADMKIVKEIAQVLEISLTDINIGPYSDNTLSDTFQIKKETNNFSVKSEMKEEVRELNEEQGIEKCEELDQCEYVERDETKNNFSCGTFKIEKAGTVYSAGYDQEKARSSEKQEARRSKSNTPVLTTDGDALDQISVITESSFAGIKCHGFASPQPSSYSTVPQENLPINVSKEELLARAIAALKNIPKLSSIKPSLTGVEDRAPTPVSPTTTSQFVTSSTPSSQVILQPSEDTTTLTPDTAQYEQFTAVLDKIPSLDSQAPLSLDPTTTSPVSTKQELISATITNSPTKAAQVSAEFDLTDVPIEIVGSTPAQSSSISAAKNHKRKITTPKNMIAGKKSKAKQSEVFEQKAKNAGADANDKQILDKFQIQLQAVIGREDKNVVSKSSRTTNISEASNSSVLERVATLSKIKGPLSKEHVTVSPPKILSEPKMLVLTPITLEEILAKELAKRKKEKSVRLS